MDIEVLPYLLSAKGSFNNIRLVGTGLKETDFQEGKLVRTEIDGKSIVIGMENGKLYAMDSVCSHDGGPVEQGALEGYNLFCP